MSLPDAAASAALDTDNIKPVWFVFLDIIGDPVRATSFGANLNISGSGQEDLDGDYIGIDHRFVSISPVKMSPGGSDPVTATLSGIRGLDDEDRQLLADKANWQGRTARIWRMVRDRDNVQQGGIQHYYTGYMMSLLHDAHPKERKLVLTIESYLAAFSGASGRTYLDQESFDENDLSARAALAISNGNSSSSLTSGAGGSPGITPGFNGGHGRFLRDRLVNR